MNYQIYTLYVNRKDILIHALNSIIDHRKEIVILDNSREQDLELEGFDGEIYRPSAPLFCSQSYNLILSLAQQRNQDVFFMMHSDAEASSPVLNALLEKAAALNATNVPWGVIFTNYDVLCLCNTKMLSRFRWDPYLPIYYVDVDFYRQLMLAGVLLVETDLTVQHLNGGSSAMKADVFLHHFIQTNYPAWREYYIRKWGGDRGQETFLAPFNQTV